MNASLKNQTQICIYSIYLTDPYNLTLNILRITVFVLFILWAMIAIFVKKFRNRKMLFLYNLNLTSFLRAVNGMTNFFISSCDVLSSDFCLFQMLSNFFLTYLLAFSLCLFTLQRLACYYFNSVNIILTWKIISFSIALVWLLSAIFTVLHVYSFDVYIYYSSVIAQCTANATKNLSTMIVMSIFGLIIPNIIVITAYLMVVIRAKRLKKSLNSFESPRTTIQLIIYIILFEVGTISNLIIVLQALYSEINVGYLIQWARILRWLQCYCPLGLSFFHPALLKIYSSFCGWNLKVNESVNHS